MGKSPGKWFKAVLFGKKSSKSNFSKGKEFTTYADYKKMNLNMPVRPGASAVDKSAIEKTIPPPNKEPAAGLPVDAPVISEPLPCPTAEDKRELDSGKVDNARLPSITQDQDEEELSSTNLNQTEDSKKVMREQAAIKAQAAFRGFLARRAFRTLQGIIKLQAVIRGCLVRRQAVATLYCVQGIVKLQALVRGHMVRGSDIGIKVHSESDLKKQDVKHAESCETCSSDRAQNLLKNAFVGKLLSMSPTAMPLRLQYGKEEPNTAWNWLLRWTVSHVWEPQSEPKKDITLKPQKSQTGQARAKSSGRRVRSASLENATNHTKSDSEKTKRKPRRGLDHSVNANQGPPTNEIEKVRCKFPQSTKDNSAQVEVDSEQPRRNQRKSRKLPASEHIDSRTGTPSDKLRVETEEAVTKSTDGETFTELPTTDSLVNDLHDHPVLSDLDKQPDDQTGNDKSEDLLSVDQTGKNKQVKDSQTSNENHKISKRSSLPAKYDDLETGLPSATKVPSYMAATESAKAKVRGQVSPRFGQDGYEKNGLTRRHSLPSSTNAKLSSSPRVQRLIQASGRGVKIDRSLSSSRDDKSIQEWRR